MLTANNMYFWDAGRDVSLKNVKFSNLPIVRSVESRPVTKYLTYFNIFSFNRKEKNLVEFFFLVEIHIHLVSL